MAKFLLTSYIRFYDKDDNGNRFAVALDKGSTIRDIIDRELSRRQRVVFVANDPVDIDMCREKSEACFSSLELSGLGFEEYVVLDASTKDSVGDIIDGANLIILFGGKVPRQNVFLKGMNFGELLQNSNALVVGISAGTMNLCKTIFNFPEELSDIGEECVIDGLGFCDKIIIPHFDCNNKKYLLDIDEFDVMKDYILPFSFSHTLVGLGNDSFVFVDGKDEKIVGEYAIITNGDVVAY